MTGLLHAPLQELLLAIRVRRKDLQDDWLPQVDVARRDDDAGGARPEQLLIPVFPRERLARADRQARNQASPAMIHPTSAHYRFHRTNRYCRGCAGAA